MTNLKIGTILIAKDDAFMDTKEKCLTKGEEYIIKSLKGNAIVFSSEYDENHEWLISEIDNDFTIKRYTLTDLQEKKIAVKLRNYEEFELICDKLNAKKLSMRFDINWYHGIDNDGDFYYLPDAQLEGRILLDSIDEIDLGDEGKEVLTTPVKVRTVEFLENLVREYENEIARLKVELGKSQEAGRCTDAMLADEIKQKVAYMKEVNQLKGEVDNLIKENDFNKQVVIRFRKECDELHNQLELRESPQISQDLTKRERMAWELYTKRLDIHVTESFELVDKFLAKSKEVGNG